MENLKKLSKIISEMNKPKEIESFLNEILTPVELKNISLRWELMQRIKEGTPQRKIASDLGISLCKITRGSKILKDQNSISNKILSKE